MSIIDVHTHPLLTTYRRLLAGSDQFQGDIGMGKLPDWSYAQHVENMDAHGIGGCVLSTPNAANLIVGKDGPGLARQMNEELAATVARNPKRIGAFAVVPLDDMDAALAETAYALDVLKLDGIGAPTQCQGRYLGMPGYEPWFEELNRRSATLFVHPDDPHGFRQADHLINVSMLEFMFETTRMVTHMVLSGTRQRFDRVNVIATHGGGAIPYLANRIAIAAQFPFMYPSGKPMTPPAVNAALASFYFDLTASTAPTMLDTIRGLVSADRLLMGFDFPLMPKQTIAPALGAFEAYAGFDDAARVAILKGNAQGLFPRFAEL
jgi:predicted TIM-barrel fold metal-dependent hydrolase